MEKTSHILVTGASGLIGSALVRLLKAEGYENVLTPTHEELDLRVQMEVTRYWAKHNPEYVFHLAAVVGGIQANSVYPVKFIFDNTQMQCNVFAASSGIRQVKKLLFPGSACAYPKDALQPIKESSFLQGIPEPTNLAYAVAKINGIIMAQSYAKQYGMKVVLPMVANTYGIGDKSSHVIPMMIEKFCHPNPIFWGTGTPLREFIYADDVADAFLFLMLNYDSTASDIINVGTEEEIPIKELATKISILANAYSWRFDDSKPDGAMRKCLDSSRIRAMGWRPKISLDEGLKRVIDSWNQ